MGLGYSGSFQLSTPCYLSRKPLILNVSVKLSCRHNKQQWINYVTSRRNYRENRGNFFLFSHHAHLCTYDIPLNVLILITWIVALKEISNRYESYKIKTRTDNQKQNYQYLSFYYVTRKSRKQRFILLKPMRI